MNRFICVLALSGSAVLAGCVAPPPKPNDPYYAPVLPRTPLPSASNNGSIYQAGFEQNLYSDRKAFRVGDIITITLNERTNAQGCQLGADQDQFQQHWPDLAVRCRAQHLSLIHI